MSSTASGTSRVVIVGKGTRWPRLLLQPQSADRVGCCPAVGTDTKAYSISCTSPYDSECSDNVPVTLPTTPNPRNNVRARCCPVWLPAMLTVRCRQVRAYAFHTTSTCPDRVLLVSDAGTPSCRDLLGALLSLSLLTLRRVLRRCRPG